MELEGDYTAQLAAAALRFLLLGLPAALAVAWLLRHSRHSVMARLLRILFLLVLYTVVAAAVLDAFMGQWGFRGDDSRFGFEALLSSEAERPFAYRVFSPAVIELGARLVPPGAIQAHREWLLETSPLLAYKRPGESWGVHKSVRWHVAYFYLFCCLFATLVVARSLLREFHPDDLLAASLGPPIAMLFLPLTFHFGGYLYDFPDLLLLFASALLLQRRRWWAFYPVFACAVLNKETGVLVILYTIAFLWQRNSRRALAAHVGAQVVIGVVLLAAIRFAFRDNPGSGAWFTLPLNALFWLEPKAYVQFIQPVAPLVSLPRGANVLTLLLVGGLCAWGWRESPVEIRRSLILSLGASFALLLVFGFLDEIRVLGPVFPALYVVGWSGVRSLWREAAASAADHSR